MSEQRRWVVVAGDFVRTGGMDAANFALASWLARSGRPVELVAHRVDAELADTPGISIHRVPRPLGSHLLGFPLLDAAGSRAGRPPHLPALLRPLLTKEPPVDAWLVANGGNCLAGNVAWLHYVHAAYTPHIAGRPLRRVAGRLAHRMAVRDERQVACQARVVIANSGLTARHAVDLLGADPARVHVVYYGSDAERFRPPSAQERDQARTALRVYDERPLLAFVGALGDRRKGFDTLFRAVSFLATEPGWGEATLLVMGEGGELEEWKRRVAQARLGSRVRFLGFRQDVRQVLAACDAVVAPTRYEAYGLAVHEALCMGLPAIVSRGAGVAERVTPPLQPLLVDDPEDAGELAGRLLAWRGDADAFRAAALELSRDLRAWTWDHMAARIVDIVEAAG